MNKLAKSFAALAASLSISTAALASAPTALDPTPAGKKAQDRYEVAQILCATLHFPSFKRGNRDIYATTGASDDTTYCAIFMNGQLITFMWF